MCNVLYRPRLPNNKEAPLNWFMKLYRWTIICWPLEDEVPHWAYLCYRLYWLMGFLVLVIHIEAKLRYLHFYSDDVDGMLTGVPTFLSVTELHLRAFSSGLKKKHFKSLLEKFYAEIYIEKSTNSKIFKQIERQMRPIRMFSLLYFCTLSTYIAKGMYFLATNRRELLYNMIPAFDFRSDFGIYLSLLISNIWTGFIVASTICGEGNTLGLVVFHLNARYLLMRQNFHDKVEQMLRSRPNCNATKNYRRLLEETLEENLRLNNFAREIQNEYTFRIFVMFAFSAMSLCALGFKVYTNPVNSISYVFWAIGKIQEIIVIGQIGSTIIHTTDQMSSMYYESNWESVINHSTNTDHNVDLMKFVNLCIVTNRKAFHLRGLNFFTVSLVSVLAILRGAGSYFTFLISIR